MVETMFLDATWSIGTDFAQWIILTTADHNAQNAIIPII